MLVGIEILNLPQQQQRIETDTLLLPNAETEAQITTDPTYALSAELILKTQHVVRSLGEKARISWRNSTLTHKIAILAATMTFSGSAPAMATDESHTASANISQIMPEYGEDQGTGGYPWADAQYLGTANVLGYTDVPVWGYKDCPPSAPECKDRKDLTLEINGVTYGLADPYGDPFRWCSSYVKQWEKEHGTDPKRFSILNSPTLEALEKNAASTGEIVDEKPTPGSVLLWPEGKHTWIVKAVSADGNQVTLMDYNGGGGGDAGKFGEQIVSPSEIFPGSKIVHLEMPAPKRSELQDAAYDKANKNGLRLNRALHDGMYIRAGDFSLLLSNGVVKLIESKDGKDTIRWKTPTAGKKAEVLSFAKTKSGRHELQLIAIRRNKPVVVWRKKLSKTTSQVKLTPDGTFAGIAKGKISAVITSVNSKYKNYKPART